MPKDYDLTTIEGNLKAIIDSCDQFWKAYYDNRNCSEEASWAIVDITARAETITSILEKQYGEKKKYKEQAARSRKECLKRRGFDPTEVQKAVTRKVAEWENCHESDA